MRIALDYDGTYTSDPKLWESFVAMAKQHGHDVKIVTARGRDFMQDKFPVDEVEDVARELGVAVVFCNGRQKQDCYGADIWIDDRPDLVIGTEQIVTLYQSRNTDSYKSLG